MGLKFKTATAAQLAAAFMSASSEGKRDGFSELLNQAEIMKNLSVKFAPVDEGDLEADHKLVRRANGSDKVTIDIVIRGKSDAYAMRIHEGQGSTWFKLGPKSKLKQGGQSERVGGKFLERAYLARAEKLITAIYDAVTAGVRKNVG